MLSIRETKAAIHIIILRALIRIKNKLLMLQKTMKRDEFHMILVSIIFKVNPFS